MSRYNEWKEYINNCLSINNSNAVFINFFALWNAYNYLYNELYNNIKYDSNKAVKIADDDFLSDYYELDIKNTALEEFQKIPSFNNEESIRNQVVDTRFNKINHNNNAKFNDTNCSLKDLLNAIYQIRCNLFHGDKTPYNDTDIKLVSWAYKYLSLILHKYKPDEF